MYVADIAQAILLFTWDKCFSHERYSPIEIPRNVIYDSMQLLPILLRGIPFIGLHFFAKLQYLCLCPMTRLLVFFALRDNLLAENYM